MASLNDIATKTTNLENNKANKTHNHESISKFLNPSGNGPSHYNVNAIFKGGGHNGIEFVTQDVNTFGMGGHQDGNFRIWYGDIDDTGANPYDKKGYIVTINKSGSINATKVYNAVWNDYAEYFERGEQTEPGDICCLDTNSKVEQYVKADCNSLRVIGVHSDTYGHIVGGDDIKEGDFIVENDKKFIPIGLVGRVKVKFTGKAKIGDYVVPSEIKGVGRAYRDGDNKNNIIGYLVESDDLDNQTRRLKIMIQRGVI